MSSKGQVYFVEIVDVQKNNAKAKIIETREIEKIKPPYVHLCISHPKFSTADKVIEKSVELGVSTLRIFTSDYSYIKGNKKTSINKQNRWKKIIKSATQQCGRADLMQILNPVKLTQILEEFNLRTNVAGLFPYEGPASKELSQAIKSLKTQSFDEIWIFVGGEGGYSEKEVNLFKSCGLESVSLGPQVLRVETACVAIVSIIKYELVL